MAVHCDNCDRCLRDYSGRQILNEVECYSSISGVADVVLCLSCSQAEEEQIYIAGTNNLPKLLAQYKERK